MQAVGERLSQLDESQFLRWCGGPALNDLAPTGVCSGWGDPHYITFDGTYYTFLDNCTYVLVQQIVPVFGPFRVLIDNYFCDPGDNVSCPQSIIVEYHQDRVVLTRRPVGGVMTNQVDMPSYLCVCVVGRCCGRLGLG